MLGLDMQQLQQQNPQNPPHQFHHPTHQMVPYPYPSYTTSKTKQHSSLSDEDPGFGVDDASNDKGKNPHWQRMKWTDNMVRLLIITVYYIGDEAGSETANDPKKKASGGGGGGVAGLAQKKGKWKSVSRAMMEGGFFVSPQQCEDKFNDLNKRYKRVNDILGKGTACRVVENQSLLDSMDLTAKMKEEVKKLLNSKHLFFKEMCAYHNSCGNGSIGVASNANQSPEVANNEQSQVQHQQSELQHQQQQKCSYSSENAQFVNTRVKTDGLKLGEKRVRNEGDDEDEDNNESDDEDEDVEEEEEDMMECHSRDQSGHRECDFNDDDHDYNDPLRKRPKRDLLSMSSSLMRQLNSELLTVIQDDAKSSQEKKQWMKLRLMQLEEQQASYQLQAFVLEKQRLKWVKFSGKKEREIERAKLENERRRLENQRMVLLVKQKELELLDLQYQLSSNKRGDPSSMTSKIVP